MNDLKHRLTDAIECQPDADADILQYWSDKRLDYGVIAEAVNSGGIAILFRIDADIDAEFCQLSWEELEADLPEWRVLGDKPSAGTPLATAAAGYRPDCVYRIGPLLSRQ